MNALVINYFERLHLHETINAKKFKATTCEKVITAIQKEFVEKNQQLSSKTLADLQKIKELVHHPLRRLKRFLRPENSRQLMILISRKIHWLSLKH